MALNGSGIRDTARVLQISPNTVLQGIRTAAQQVPEPQPPRRIADLGRVSDLMLPRIGVVNMQFNHRVMHFGAF